MKKFAIALLLVAIVFVIGLLLAQVGKALFTGQSFPHPAPKVVVYTAPFSVP